MKKWHSITAFIMLMAVMSSFDVVSTKKISQYEYNNASKTQNQMSQELELDSIFRNMPRNFSDPENIEVSHKSPKTEIKSKMTNKSLPRTKRTQDHQQNYRKLKKRKQKYRELDRHSHGVCLKSFDWRKKGAVTEVKHQGKCNSCWAFAATGTIEAQYFKSTGKLVNMSEQNLIDCVQYDHCGVSENKHDNYECDGGGLIEDALNYTKTNGIYSEDDYKYEGFSRECRQDRNKPVYRCEDYEQTLVGDEYDLKYAICRQGPVAASIDVRTIKNIEFYSKKNGIFKNPNCDKHNTKLNHCILIVGYNETIEGEKYWIVKNSYGEEPPMLWGHGVFSYLKGWEKKGYFRLARQEDNMCGIATDAWFAKDCKLN